MPDQHRGAAHGAISGLSLDQSFFDGALSLRIGKQDANDLFVLSEVALAFLHSSAGYPPNNPMPSYPEQDLGAALELKPVAWLRARLGVFQAEPDGRRSPRQLARQTRVPFLIGELTWKLTVFGRSGAVTAGAWYSDLRTPDLSEAGSPERRGLAGLYLIMDQSLWRGAGETPPEVLAFGQLGLADPDRSEAPLYVGFGLLARRVVPKRPEDELGAALYLLRFSRFTDTERSEEATVELFYRARLLGSLTLTPDLQLIHAPGGRDEPMSVAVGARATLSF